MDTFGITFTPKTLKAFKEAHAEAENGKQDTFTAEKKVWLTQYAGYLIKYLEATFEGQRLAGKPEEKIQFEGKEEK